MVSFQCDGCQDIVKKPKLDLHHSRGCNASFTCIDCSKTFPTPADWKGHTSCVSESQKYEKSLYKPKTKGAAREQHAGAASVGKYQGRGGQWGRPPLGGPRFQATGANGTPLGSPPRMSPVTTPKATNEKKDASTLTPAVSTEPAKEKEKKSSKKIKSGGGGAEAIETVALSNGTKPEETKLKKKKEKKDKRDKNKDESNAETTGNGVTNSATEPHNIPLPPSPAADATPEDLPKPKKSKKEKRKEEKEAAVLEKSDKAMAVDSTTNGDDGRKKKKKKGHKSGETVAAVDGDVSMGKVTGIPEEKKSKKRKRDTEGEAEAVTATAKDAAEGDAKKRKKKKKEPSS